MHIVPSPNRPAPTATRSCLIAMLTSRVMIAPPKLAGYRPVLVRAKAQKGKGGLESRVTSHRPAPPLLSPSCRAFRLLPCVDRARRRERRVAGAARNGSFPVVSSLLVGLDWVWPSRKCGEVASLQFPMNHQNLAVS